MHFELFTACVLGFFYTLRISEIEALKREDISADSHGGGGGGSYIPIRIKQSQIDIFKDGIM